MKNLVITTAALLVALTTTAQAQPLVLKANSKPKFETKMVNPGLLKPNTPIANKPIFKPKFPPATKTPGVTPYMVNPNLLGPTNKSMVNPGLINHENDLAPKPLVDSRPPILKPTHPKPTIIQPWTPEFHPEVYPKVYPERSPCSLTRVRRHTTSVCKLPVNRGIYVPCLGARMDIQTISLAHFGPIRVARIISMDLHSPLAAMGLQRGDCLTRVGNVRIDSTFDLERLPSGQMEVRFVEHGAGHVQRTVVSLAQNGLAP